MIKFFVRVICCFIPQKEKRKKTRKYLLETLYRIKYRKNIIIPPQGLGDILYILLILSGKEEKYTIFLTKKYFGDLCNLFPEVISKKVYMNQLPYSPYALYKFSDIYKESYQENFYKLFKNVNGGEFNKEKHIPISVNAVKTFNKLNLVSGKTVLILPEAKSCPNITSDYWLKYAQFIEKSGYEPVFNSNLKFGKYKNIFLSISDTITFATLSGNIIGYRSGLCDVLAYFSSARGIYLYPDNPYDYHASYIKDYMLNKGQKYMEFCSLKTFNQSKNIQEYIIKENEYPFWK